MGGGISIQLLGIALVAFALADVFLIVLYARGGAGIFSHRLDTLAWSVFRSVGRRLPAGPCDLLLSFCGPVVLVLMACIWVLLLSIGCALILWPAMGTGIRASHGETPTDFISALYIALSEMTTVGAGDLTAQTPLCRIVLGLDSAVGISVITLVVTYFVQIYSALLRRNSFALSVDHATCGTGDAAELLASLAAGGDLSQVRPELAMLGRSLTELYETQHFYPSLHFFRFREPFYSPNRTMLVLMDLVTLTRTALDERSAANVINSSSVAQLWKGGMHLLTELSRIFLPPHGEPTPGEQPDDRAIDCWRRRYRAALARLRQAGIATHNDERAGEDQYVKLRKEWDPYITAWTNYMARKLDEIDPAIAACKSPRPDLHDSAAHEQDDEDLELHGPAM